MAQTTERLGGRIGAIETCYGGCRFRSRLEARWAVCFDALGLEWEYEPEGYRLPGDECYLPDFWLPQVNIYAEVKAGRSHERLDAPPAAREKAIKLAMVTNRPVLLLDWLASTNHWGIWPLVEWDGFDADGLPWIWCDVDLFEAHAYHQSEGRLYTSTTARELEHAPETDVHPAVAAARAARFEHGESPTSSSP